MLSLLVSGCGTVIRTDGGKQAYCLYAAPSVDRLADVLEVTPDDDAAMAGVPVIDSFDIYCAEKNPAE